MTASEINAAIAKNAGIAPLFAVEKGGMYYREGGCGYTDAISHAGRYTEADAKRELVSGEPMSIVPLPLPNYHDSLDAIMPVVRALDDDSRCQVVLQLVKITIQGPMFAGYFATAAQWCEAYLKSKGLWK